MASLPQVINTYTEAVQTVDVEKAVGKPHQLWVEFSKFYETNGQLAEVSEAVILSYYSENGHIDTHTGTGDLRESHQGSVPHS